MQNAKLNPNLGRASNATDTKLNSDFESITKSEHQKSEDMIITVIV